MRIHSHTHKVKDSDAVNIAQRASQINYQTDGCQRVNWGGDEDGGGMSFKITRPHMNIYRM